MGPGGLLFGGALASGPGAPLAAQPHSILKPSADLHNSRESAELKGPSSLPEERLVSMSSRGNVISVKQKQLNNAEIIQECMYKRKMLYVLELGQLILWDKG